MISPVLRRTVPDRLWLRRWTPAKPIPFRAALVAALMFGPLATALAEVWLAVLP